MSSDKSVRSSDDSQCDTTIKELETLSTSALEGKLVVPEQWNLAEGREECVVGGVQEAKARQLNMRKALKERVKLQKVLVSYGWERQQVYDAIALERGGVGVCSGFDKHTLE